ncbi:MAG: ChbG/HpnK family deacetylase, partial [bacterium]
MMKPLRSLHALAILFAAIKDRVSSMDSWKSFLYFCICAISFLILSMTRMTNGQDIKLIIRGDDMGMTQGSLVAFKRAFNQGVLTCGSIIVPAPWFEGAAALCKKNQSWCVGVHLCLVGEWQGYRWRPVLPWSNVPTLVDKDGFFYGSPNELWAHNPRIEEIDAELNAQVELAIRKGINVQYLDTHYMGLSSYPSLKQIILEIGRHYRVPISSRLGEKRCRGVYKVPVEQKEKMAIKMLEDLGPGLWLWVCHIGIDSPEQNALIHTDPKDVFTNGGVGLHRASEL